MSATHEATIRARIPRPLKKDTDAVFKLLGISSSEAIRMFLTQVSLRRGLPFPVEVPAVEAADTTAQLLGNRKNGRRLRAAIAVPDAGHVVFESVKELKHALGV